MLTRAGFGAFRYARAFRSGSDPAEFVAPALTGFGAMALVGFFAAIGPTVLAQDLHETNHAVAGALFGEMAIIVSATILATQSMSSGTAMRLGLWPMIPSVALFVSAQVLASMWLLIVATAFCAVAAGLGYRGSLQVVNQIAPDRNAPQSSPAISYVAFPVTRRP